MVVPMPIAEPKMVVPMPIAEPKMVVPIPIQPVAPVGPVAPVAPVGPVAPIAEPNIITGGLYKNPNTSINNAIKYKKKYLKEKQLYLNKNKK
jgi:hypothetical protein